MYWRKSLLARGAEATPCLTMSDGSDALEIDWQSGEDGLQVTVFGRFPAADGRQMRVDYHVDKEQRIVHLSCSVAYKGKRYRHESVLRGFCLIPDKAFKDCDPDTFDWRAQSAW